MHHNRQNTRYLAKSKSANDPSVRFVAKSKFPAKAMSFELVGTDGFVFKPIWIEGTLNSKRYIEILDKEVFPALDEHYGVGNYTLQQDGAPWHTSNVTQKYLIGVQGILAKDDVAPQLTKPEPFELPFMDARGDPCLC